MQSLNLNQGISTIIAVYNESENIKPLVAEIEQSFASLRAQEPIPYEIIVVDDGSQDDTPQRLKSLVKSHPNLRVIRHQRNKGQSTAIATGIQAAQYPWIITLDGDGQNDPSDFAKLIDTARKAQLEHKRSAILVVGNRKKRDDSFIRRLSSRTANNVRKSLLRDDCPDTGCGLKLFPKQVFLQLPHFNHMHRFLPALFRRAGGIVVNVPVNHRPRNFGKSKYGINNRLWVGIVDLIGVMWLIRRPCHTENHNDIPSEILGESSNEIPKESSTEI